MPLYEYACQRCGKTFELMQKFSDAPVTIHEGCGGAVERLISAPALQFKGSGWYITDYARNGKDSGSGSKSKPDTKTESKAESKTESKTESKPNTPASSS
ncbi:MAG TPA: FmdB family zinc ribbon protein [Bryobacteraceae bacterium]|jgi:putative FmdB family regulatory protein